MVNCMEEKQLLEEIEKLNRTIQLLDEEGVHKCEKLDEQSKEIKRLEKGIDILCKTLADFKVIPFYKAEDWKEWCFKDDHFDIPK